MEKIIKALKELGIGRHDLATVAATMDGNLSPWEAGKMARSVDGLIVDGMRIKIEDAGRKVFISLHNSMDSSFRNLSTSRELSLHLEMPLWI